MASNLRHNDMSLTLVPYVPEQSREIVLRHDSTVVVYDQRSRHLSLRHAPPQSDALEPTNCPTCHRPYHEDIPTQQVRGESPPSNNATDQQRHHWMDPSYFRMLQNSAANSRDPSQPPPSSPRRRIAQPSTEREQSQLRTPDGVEFIGSEPRRPSRKSGISAQAFSQGYFESFFVEEKELGRGGKGVVLLVKHVLDGVELGQFACKRVPVGDDHVWLEKVLVEVQLLQNLSHQNLVSYRHVWLEDFQVTNFGPSVPCAFILQQFCNGGDLHNYVLGQTTARLSNEQLKDRMRRRSKGQPELAQDLNGSRKMMFEEIFSFFKDITSGIHHLHSHGYIHRDLKPNNCLLHDDGKRLRVLVSDFGEVQMENVTRLSTGATGTISYCAPEVLLRDSQGSFGNFTTKSDVFSLGMIVYFMCFGKLPYSNADDINEEKEDLDQLRAEISTWAGFDDERRIRSDLPDKLYKFLRRLLSLNPADRPSTEDILQSIKAGTTIDELDQNESRPSFMNDLRHRISNLDSPAPTPQRRHSTQSTPHLTVPTFKRPPPSNLRQQASEDFQRTPSPGSPAANNGGSNLLESDNTLSRVHSPIKPRLALPPPPPSTRTLILHRLSEPTTLTAIRCIIFLLKVYLLSSMCFPYAASSWITLPLLVVALLDFVKPQALYSATSAERHEHGLRGTLLLLAVHLIVVFAMAKTGTLCLLGRWT